MPNATSKIIGTAFCLLAFLPSTQAQSPAAAPPKGSLRIAVMNDMSGPYADTSGPGAVVAAQMAAEDFGGKVLGRPIEILAGDHLNKPDVGAQLVRRWIDEQNVEAIADVNTSSVALAVQNITREKGRVFLISGAASEDLTGKFCSPFSIQTADNTQALAAGTTKAVVEGGARDWFFITADYTFGHVMEQASTKVLLQNGGRVVGRVRHPAGISDFSSFLLAAQGSGAQAIGLANAGDDTTNTIKQAAEFGITRGGQKMVGQILYLSHIESLGLGAAQGLLLTEGFYWDQNDAARAWTRRFEARAHKKPTREQAVTYATVTHYLNAIQAAGTTDAATVVAAMKAAPMEYFGKTAHIRRDGRAVYDLTLYEVKSPAESKYPGDYYKPVRAISGMEAFGPESESACPTDVVKN